MSEKAKFTPGPWRFEESNGVIYGDHSRILERAGEANWTANARLIAKAPEMYALLERLGQRCSADAGKMPHGDCEFCAALALLASIDGEGT